MDRQNLNEAGREAHNPRDSRWQTPKSDMAKNNLEALPWHRRKICSSKAGREGDSWPAFGLLPDAYYPKRDSLLAGA